MKQFVLDHFQSVYRDSRLNMEEGDLLIHHPSGKRIALIVINRAVRLAEVKERYEKNTAKKIHTLFLFDRRLLPSENSEVEAPTWMLTVHNLNNGRVYGYWNEGRDITIRPLHLGWKWGSKIRSVQYGSPVDTKTLTLRFNDAAVGTLEGVYAIADFNEGVFWTKRDPNGGQYNYYSWRSWRDNGPRPNQNTTRDDNWDAEEEFNQSYGNDEREEPHRQQRQYQRQQRQQQRPPRRVPPTPDRVHYATLGVPVGATLDEVKQAYRRKAREYHPDLHPDQSERYTAKMADINAAFEAISKKLSR